MIPRTLHIFTSCRFNNISQLVRFLSTTSIESVTNNLSVVLIGSRGDCAIRIVG
jgi:hypothetical protein